jgi:hypothetical protein
MEQLKGKVEGSVLMIPDVMLKEGKGVFIDDMTLDCLQRGLGKNAVVFESSPEGLYEAVRLIKAS